MLGYAGKILRIDLTNRKISEEVLSPEKAETWVGGAGLGARILYDEVPPSAGYDSPENKIIFASGPLGATSVNGSGTIAVITRGALTGGVASSQANGFFGAYLKFCGYDAFIIEGQSPDWVYLYISDTGVEIRNAGHLLGKSTWDTEDVLTGEIEGKTSIYSIGPAGEHKVRYAAIVGDHGHVVAHNGTGSVLGAKKLKAIAVLRGKKRFPVADDAALKKTARELAEGAKKVGLGTGISTSGTGEIFPVYYSKGGIPIKNYARSVFLPDEHYEKYSGVGLRAHFEHRKKSCYACAWAHCAYIKIKKGKFAGREGEEPEFEALTGMGPNLGISDLDATVYLGVLADNLGMDVNESSWTLGWVMECFEKGLLKEADLDGIRPTWGNAEAVEALLIKISTRSGCGAWLAEGVKRSAERIGGKAIEYGVYTLKGNTPRGHDHRALWTEFLDTVTSSTGTIEATGGTVNAAQHGLSPVTDPFSWKQIATLNGKTNGRRVFEDSLGICRFPNEDIALIVKAVNLATGWNWDVDRAMKTGRRIANLLRIYNFRCGITAETEFPSKRYGSTPHDGPAAGMEPGKVWLSMRALFYETMGWDRETGKPLPETLRDLGLGEYIGDLYPEK